MSNGLGGGLRTLPVASGGVPKSSQDGFSMVSIDCTHWGNHSRSVALYTRAGHRERVDRCGCLELLDSTLEPCDRFLVPDDCGLQDTDVSVSSAEVADCGVSLFLTLELLPTGTANNQHTTVEPQGITGRRAHN